MAEFRVFYPDTKQWSRPFEDQSAAIDYAKIFKGVAVRVLARPADWPDTKASTPASDS